MTLCVQGLKKINNDLKQYNKSLSQDLNTGPSK